MLTTTEGICALRTPAQALLVPRLLATAARACMKQLEISTVRMQSWVTHLHWPTAHKTMQQTQHCDHVWSHKQASCFRIQGRMMHTDGFVGSFGKDRHGA